MEICRIEEFETMNFEFYVEKNAENLNSHMHVHKYTEMIIFTKGTAGTCSGGYADTGKGWECLCYCPGN